MISSNEFMAIYALCILALLACWRTWQRSRLERAEQWPETEGTIESADVEVVAHSRSRDIELPVCAFCYKVDGEYYSGRFSLMPGTDPTEYPVRTLVDRKIPVRYDPQSPSKWFIPLKELDQCIIEQKIRPHFVRLYPKD